MKAAVLKQFGSPLAIETLPDPVLGTGEVIVDVMASRVLAYANEVLSGERKYLLELPVVPGPGAIGRVRATGPDATHLAKGDWVYCDPTVRSRDDALAPDIALQGLTAGSEGGLRLQRYFHDGAWAGQMRVPTENADPDRQHCRGGRRAVVRAGHAAGAVWRLPRRAIAGRRDRVGQRRHRQLWQRGGGRRVGHGRGLRHRNRPQRKGAGRSRAPVRPARPYRCRCAARRTTTASGSCRPPRADRLRARHPAAGGQRDAGADRHPGGAAVRTRGADGRRRHARRRRPRPALFMDDAELHHASRPMDVPAARDPLDGRA